MTENKGFNFKRIFMFLLPVLMMVIVSGAAIGFYAIKFNRASALVKDRDGEYSRVAKENREWLDKYNKLQGDIQRMQQQLNVALQDRDNFERQARNLLADKERLNNVEASLENSTKDIGMLQKEKEDIIAEKEMLAKKLIDMELVQKQLINEKDEIALTLDKERSKSFLKNIEQENSNVKKENNLLAVKLKQAQQELAKAQDSEFQMKLKLDSAAGELGILRDKSKNYNRAYAEALRKNRVLEDKLINMPKKFAEIARQNKILIKQTSTMHYNLGVYYTQRKLYSRAIGEFERALESNPNDAYSHFNLGYIYAEFAVDRAKAIEHFRQYLRLAKKDDKDVDWAKKYMLTWESWGGKKVIE